MRREWCRSACNISRVHPDGDAGMDFYDVSLVDGYNVPMLGDLLGDELRWRICSRARARAWLLGRSSTAAAVRTARPMPASRRRILRCLRAHVHVHTTTPIMIKPEP
ncbi:Osmotin/thaumatin-like superfamily [Abeliophyllum distichum]|uniref:Osmotin/thaumatin-like superfamily n=1 Tax=Abeliophyllum distichum TaxID=126358 RepID=A0ABD1SK05_9LAMI